MSKKGTSTIWNERTDAILRDMFTKGEPLDDITSVIGCCDDYVRTRAKALGLERPPNYNRYAFHGRYTKLGRYRET